MGVNFHCRNIYFVHEDFSQAGDHSFLVYHLIGYLGVWLGVLGISPNFDNSLFIKSDHARVWRERPVVIEEDLKT